MTTIEAFLGAMIIILAAPLLVWRAVGAPIILPLVVLQIIGGIILGPGIFGTLLPDLHAAIFQPDVIGALSGIAWWSVMLFVFLAGLEVDLAAAWNNSFETGLTAALALTVPFIFGAGAGAVILLWPGWIGPQAAHWQAVLGFGMACAITALPILVLFLTNLGILRTPLGQRVLRYASLDDVAIWAVLALILLDWDRIDRQLGFIVVFAIAAILARKAMLGLRPTDRWPFALIWVAICALAADWAGLHFMVGAFLSGVVMDAKWFGEHNIDQLRAALLLTVMPVYFFSTGLKTTWSLGGSAVFAVAGVLLVAAVAGKLIGTQIAGRILGWSRQEASVIGWLLQTKALIMIIFTNILFDKQIISANSFTALLLMAVGSTMLTMPIVVKKLAALAPAQIDV